MDKMLDSDSTQASSLFHSQDHVAYFPAFHIVLLLLLQRGYSLKPFAFLELFFTDVVAFGFPFSRASPLFEIAPLSEQELDVWS